MLPGAMRMLYLVGSSRQQLILNFRQYGGKQLPLAYYNKCNNREKAVAALEKAFALDNTDARILMELDQLYKKLGRSYAERLTFLEKHVALVESRDDLALERITLYNQLGRYSEAKALLAARKFHPWEGGEGKVTGQDVFVSRRTGKRSNFCRTV